ncbi:MAG: hypothetical protein C6Y22_23540 [Hapalosiphonaceae cyanobacterium JJU2]|nr:MAG: hypothetical protein C6Y22_23540 [Hapalosiphonaceae cyanobacterium JJU2]TBR61609.1 hypothetical protein B4U84_12705 [Westiellopsis prolifica IICB1]
MWSSTTYLCVIYKALVKNLLLCNISVAIMLKWERIMVGEIYTHFQQEFNIALVMNQVSGLNGRGR